MMTLHESRLYPTTKIRTLLSLYPAKRVLPSADHASERHSGSAEFFPTPTNSGLSSSTIDLLSKSKTNQRIYESVMALHAWRCISDSLLMQLAVAAQSQYLFGLKTRAFTTSPASKEYKCFPSDNSQSIVIPSLPPEAHSEPSGETVTVLMYPVCP